MVDYITKINDFKKVLSEIVNPLNNRDKQDVIDALFDNVRINYEEYKDVIPRIPVYYEPYEYHILQPIVGGYDLLDFLLNRAIADLEIIKLKHLSEETRDGNEHSNHHEIYIGLNRYSRIEKTGKYSPDLIKMQYKKSKYHETLHALHSQFENKKGCFYSNDDAYFRKKVAYFYDKLGRKYSNILSPYQIRDAVCNKKGSSIIYPFEVKGWSGTGSAMNEFSTEMEAVINSGLIYSKPEASFIGKNHIQFRPNFDNGYGPFQTFMLQFKSLVDKQDYFMSVFFHNSLAVEKFAFYYSDEILSNAGKFAIKENNLSSLLSFLNLFKFAISCVNDQYDDEFEVYETLAKIFIAIYDKKLLHIEKIDDETLELYKKTFAISYNQSPVSCVDGKVEQTWISKKYFDFYNRVSRELENRNSIKRTTK